MGPGAMQHDLKPSISLLLCDQQGWPVTVTLGEFLVFGATGCLKRPQPSLQAYTHVCKRTIQSQGKMWLWEDLHESTEATAVHSRADTLCFGKPLLSQQQMRVPVQ